MICAKRRKRERHLVNTTPIWTKILTFISVQLESGCHGRSVLSRSRIAEYADSFLTDLIREHQMNKRKWIQMEAEVEQNLEQIRYTGTKEGQEEAAKKKEPAVSIWFKRQQLEATIKKRRDELEALDDLFHTNYTKAERNEAKKAQLPLSEPLPMQYELLGSDAGPSGTTASSSASGSGSSQQPQQSQQQEEEQQEAPAAA